MKIKAEKLKEWVKEELSYASNPQQAIVEYRERLLLGGYRVVDSKKLNIDVDVITEAINIHHADIVELGSKVEHYTDESDCFKWTIAFSVYV